ncbi:MAG: prepilin-type N-terminal cleavage/methylation domain-containing protein [Candidatus Spechtbacterales bacterium]
MYEFEKEKGFTIIELLVVIAIIGLLSSIVFVILGGRREAANETKARADMVQLIKAAELVYSVYGYYPNDSHGSIICPENIVIEPIAGRKWGEIVRICNDPWGRPYEWNNKCTDGQTRHPTTPNPGCDSYSGSLQGVYGVTMVGENGINDSCSGDDICFGLNGHSLYGWSSSSGGEPPPPGGSCTTQVASCSGLTLVQCPDRQGCFVGSSSCSGTYDSSCSIYDVDQTSCQNTSGCTWNSSASCGGTPTACSAYSNATSCQDAGCTANFSGSCGGTARACSTWNNTNSGTCTAQSGCSWTASTKTCSGTHNPCNTYSNESTCTANLDCSWSSSFTSCSGTPNACAGYSTEPQCTSFGCTWSTGTSCSGTYSSSCSVYDSDQTSCESTTGCAWGESSCEGTAVSCSSFSDETSCNLEAGCLWQ